MNKENKIDLEIIRTELQKRMDYKNPFKAFKNLFLGWRAQGIRNKKHPPQHYSNIWKRGWLQKEDANSLSNYCIRGWDVV